MQKEQFHGTYVGNHNFLSRVLFIHLFTYFWKLKSRVINRGQKFQYDHLPQISENESIENDLSNLPQNLTTLKLAKYVFFGTLRYKTIYVLSLYIIESACRNMTSVVMSLLIASIMEGNSDSYKYAGVLVAISFLANLSRHHSITQSMEFSAKARFILLNQLYNNLLSQREKIDLGKVISLATAELSMLEYYFMLIFQIFVVPMSFIFGSVILCIRFNGPIGLAGIGIIMLVYPLQTLIQRKAITFTRMAKEQQDKRMQHTNQFVEQLRLIKMYVWQSVFLNPIKEIRKQEQDNYMNQQKYQALDRSFNFFAQIWGSCIFFVILYCMGHDLHVQDMISTIQLLQYFKSNGVQQVSYGIQSMLNINMTFQRFISVYKYQENNLSNEILIKDGSLASLKNHSYLEILKNISLTIYRGDFVAISGKVGCGKSTLLKQFLTKINSQSLTQSDNLSKGYVEQEPFLFQDTIRQNILFGRPYIPDLFERVLKCTKLDEDLDKMELKDLTLVADKGTTLSGGQKVRIALARALYSMPDLYLLDDPFSALDKNVGIQIFKMIQSFIFSHQPTQTNKTPAVILVTNSKQILSQFIHIYQLDKELIKVQNQQYDDIQDVENIKEIQDIQQNKEQNKQQNNTQSQSQQDQQQQQRYQEQQNIYLRYFKQWDLGSLIVLIVVLMNLFSEVLYNLYYRMISSYEDYKNDNQVDILFYIVGILCGLAFLNNYLKYLLNSYGCYNANSKIHNNILTSIGNCQIAYFDTHPPSQVLSVFSTDLHLADSMVNQTLFDLWELGSYFMASLIALVILQPYFSIFTVITIILNYLVYSFFRIMILSTKEVDLSTRALMVDQFKKTINGLQIIQVYEQEKWFSKQFLQLSNRCIMSNISFYYAQRVFAFQIDLIGFIVQAIGLYALIELNSNKQENFIQALLLLLIFNENQQWFLRQFLSFGSYMNSVKRMCDLNDIEQENQDGSEIPNSNDIVFDFEQVNLRFKSQYALKDFNFQVYQNDKIGIVGRTGSGKSSIISVIYRMYEVESANKLNFYGKDIRSIKLDNLRKNIAIITQTPFIFKGTVKFNIDPFGKFEDWKIKEILQKVNLEMLELDQQIDGLSIGQKQLLCLARILMSEQQIIILDEATANVDNETDHQIQQLINQLFKGRTILAIAHKLETLLGYNKILRIDNGSSINNIQIF